MQNVSAFVLAGGLSSRLGRDKALLSFGDRSFLQIALDNARSVGSTPIIVGSRFQYAKYGEVIEDRIPGCGPLSGIHAALCASASDLNLVLSVDMPLMDPKFLQWLTGIAAADKGVVTVPQCGGRLQPLCALYRRAALPHIEAALQAGRYKVEGVFANIATRIVTEGEITSAGFTANIFRNINTPEEYESVSQLSLAGTVAGKGRIHE